MIRALISICLLAATSYGAEVPTYIVIGQSNVGTPATNTMVYNRGSFPDSRVTLWSGVVGSLNLVSNQTLRAPATKHWGIEMLAGQVLADWHNGENIAIVKVYKGGTSLHTDWQTERLVMRPFPTGLPLQRQTWRQSATRQMCGA